MFRSYLSALLILGLAASCVYAETPPIQPKVQDTPLPPEVELPAPENIDPAVANKPLSVQEAIAIALQKQPEVATAQSAVNAAIGRVMQQRSGLLPSLTTSASYTNNAISNGIISSTTGYAANAAVKQLLFDFNNTRNRVKQASALQRSAGANLSKVQSSLILQVKHAYYTYAQNQRLVTVNEANVHNQQDHLALAQARLNEGVGLPADVVRAQTAVASAIYGLTTARNNASVAEVDLAQLMGVDPRTPIITQEEDEPPVAETDANKLVQTAMQQRPEIRQAASEIQAANYGLSAAKTSNTPTMNATLGWQQKGDTISMDNQNLLYGVTVTWTPFDSGLTRGKVQEAQANLKSSQSQLQSTQLQVVSEVSQAYVNMQTAEQGVVTADAEVANADEALRLLEGRYSAGLGTFLDVLDAQTALLVAKTNRVNAQTAVNQARAALKYAIGSAK